jgi:hypothetical protein
LTNRENGESRKPKKYIVNIEGVEHHWSKPTITVAEVRSLASWDAGQEVILVDLKENTERTLRENETITLKPGAGFGKKVQFKRG